MRDSTRGGGGGESVCQFECGFASTFRVHHVNTSSCTKQHISSALSTYCMVGSE